MRSVCGRLAFSAFFPPFFLHTWNKEGVFFFTWREFSSAAPISVSNVPALLGWNTTMSIETIMAQMESSYGKPSPAMLFTNDSLFKSPIAATDSPEALFYRMEQCQEVMTLGNLPYTTKQIIANAVRILMASKMFPTRDTYPALKTFFHEAYNRRLNAMDLQNTSGALGYAPAQNMYNVLDYGQDNESTTNGSLNVPPTGVGTEAVSTIGAGPSMANSTVHSGLMAVITQSIAPAFNQVVQNQTTLQQQIAALSVARAPPVTQARPVQQVAFPMQQPFQQIGT